MERQRESACILYIQLAGEVERARNKRINVCEEMLPKGFAKEILDGLKRNIEINAYGMQSIPEASNFGEV